VKKGQHINRLALFCEQMLPAAEKTHSAGMMNTVGMQRKYLTSFD